MGKFLIVYCRPPSAAIHMCGTFLERKLPPLYDGIKIFSISWKGAPFGGGGNYEVVQFWSYPIT